MFEFVKRFFHPTKPSEEEKCDLPHDLDTAFEKLNTLLLPEDLKIFKNCKENEVCRYHFGLGRWLRNNWGLWKGSELSRWFNARGIVHVDDMSGIILTSYWRHLNGKPIELEAQIKYYQEYWSRTNVSI